MAVTKFYFSSERPMGIAPAIDGGWTRTADFTASDILRMSPTKDGSALSNFTTWGNTGPAANATALMAQLISDPMIAGIAFATTDTFAGQMLCQESAVNDNINRLPIAIKVFSEDGLTLRATLKALGAYGPNTTEWVAGTLTNKTISTSTVLGANYTSVLGDRLVIEIGSQVSSAGGTSVTGTQQLGSSSSTDLPVDETTTAADNAWISFTLASGSITFATERFDWWQQTNQPVMEREAMVGSGSRGIR